MENVFRVCVAWYKHERGWANLRQICKPSTSSLVCITVKNSPNPSKNVLQRFSKFQPTRECINEVHLSSFQLKNLFKFVVAWLTREKQNILTSQLCLHTRIMDPCSHANTPLGQSESAYYLSNFIKDTLPVPFRVKPSSFWTELLEEGTSFQGTYHKRLSSVWRTLNIPLETKNIKTLLVTACWNKARVVISLPREVLLKL